MDAIDSLLLLLLLKAETHVFILGAEDERLTAEKTSEIKFESRVSVVPPSSTGG